MKQCDVISEQTPLSFDLQSYLMQLKRDTELSVQEEPLLYHSEVQKDN